MKKITLLTIVFSCISFYCTAQYTANFSVLDRGLVRPPTRIGNCLAVENNHNPANCANYNVNGMNWTLTGTTSDPFSMLQDITQFIERSYAHTIAGSKFETFRTFGDICVTSPVINIASAGTVTINLAVKRSGTGNYISVNDDVEFKYILNGGTPVSSGSLTGGTGTTASRTWMVSGNTLQVFACMAQNDVDEQYQVTTFSVSGGVVIPIELSGFFAKINADNHIVLNWQTAMENNNAYFDIERSADGQHFKSISQVKSLGNTTTGFAYEYPDNEPLEGIAYYRLKQVDLDGTFEYSPVVSVNREKTTNKARIMRNPVAHSLDIGFVKANNKLLTLSIFDLTGKIVAQETRLQNAESQLTMDVNELPTGVYVLKIAGKDIQETHKFVKN